MEADIMKFLDLQYFDNRLIDYFLSVAVFVGIWGFLKICHYTLLKRLDASKFQRLVNARRALAQIFSSIHPSIFPFIALAAAIKRLKIPNYLDKSINYVVLLVVVLQAVILASRIADYFIERISFGKGGDDLSIKSARNNLAAIAKGTIWIAGILFLLSNLGVNITTFVTGLGIGGIAIALAAQSMLGDVFSSFVIAIDKPFEIGDSIVIDKMSGTVESIGLKTTRIRSIGGELIVVANSDLTGTRIQNFKRMSTRRIVFKLAVSYDATTEQLKAIPDIMKKIVQAAGNAQFDRAHFLEFAEGSLNFEVVYFIGSSEYRDYCDAQQKINLAIREQFNQEKIPLAFPTKTVFIEKTSKV